MVAITDVPALYKTLFNDDEVLDLTYKGRVLWALMPKKKNFTGSALDVPLIYSPPGGRSATFTDAQSLADDGVGAENFLLTRKTDYQMVNLDGDSVEAADGDEGSFVDLFETHVEKGLSNLGRTINFDLYRGGYGVRGQIASGGISSAVSTLADAKTAVYFERNQTLVLSTQADGTSIKSGTVKVSAVDRSAGTVTCTANVTAGVATAAALDYIYIKGDNAKKILGLDAYCPAAAPSGTFKNVNRSNDPDRLGGIRAGDLSSLSLEEAVLVLNDTAFTNGEAEVDINLIHSLRYTDLCRELGSKKQIVDVKYGNIGFKGLAIDHAGGSSILHGDRDCQYTALWGVEKKALFFASLGMAPRPLNVKGTTKDGTHFNPNADGIVLRLGYRGELACRGPSLLSRATI